MEKKKTSLTTAGDSCNVQHRGSDVEKVEKEKKDAEARVRLPEPRAGEMSVEGEASTAQALCERSLRALLPERILEGILPAGDEGAEGCARCGGEVRRARELSDDAVQCLKCGEVTTTFLF